MLACVASTRRQDCLHHYGEIDRWTRDRGESLCRSSSGDRGTKGKRRYARPSRGSRRRRPGIARLRALERQNVSRAWTALTEIGITSFDHSD